MKNIDQIYKLASRKYYSIPSNGILLLKIRGLQRDDPNVH